MNANERNERGANELNDEELEEISGGTAKTIRNCRCPRCNQSLYTIEGTACPNCLIEGVKSPMVKA